MKNLVKFLVPVAAAAIALVSCNKEGNYTAPEANAVTIRVHASANDLKADDNETKTYIDTYQGTANTILWGTGEYMKLALTAGETTTFANSTDASANLFNGDPAAMFEFSVTPGSASEYVYQGLYPASAAVDNTNADNYKVKLPLIQNATASSYDPAAYIMVAEPKSFPSVQEDWDASFRRATALNKVTLTGLDDNIVSVEFTAPDGVKLAGNRHINLTTGASADIYNGSNTVTVKYESALTDANKVIWFTSWGAEIAEGAKLKIVAKSATKSYTREITARSEGIKFTEGYLNTLKVSMSSVIGVDLPGLEGDYIIVAKAGGVFHAMTTTFDTKYWVQTATTVADDTAIDLTSSATNFAAQSNASYKWTLEKATATTYYLKHGDAYAKAGSSGNGSEVDSDNKVAYSVSYDETTGEASINDGTVELRYNSSAPRFTFYNIGGQNAIYLIPYDAVATPCTLTISCVSNTVTITPNPSNAVVRYTIDGSDPTSYSTQYTDPFAITSTVTVKAKAFAPSADYSDSDVISQECTYVNPSAAVYYTKLTDVSEIVSGEQYVVVGTNGATSYAIPVNPTLNNGKIAGSAIPVSSNGILASDATGYLWTLTKSGDYYILSDGTNNLYHSNGGSSGTNLGYGNSTYKWDITAAPSGATGVFKFAGVNGTTVNNRGMLLSGTNFGGYALSNITASGYSAIDLYANISSVTWVLKSISVTTPPTKTTYTAGESFNPAGMVVTGHFEEDGNSTNTKDEAVTGYTITPDGALSVSDTQVTITYQGKSVVQAITVNAAPAGNDGSLEHPYTVSEVRAYMDASDSNRGPVYITGIVSSVYAVFDQSHGTGIFYISDDGETTSDQFEAYSVKFLGNNAWVNGNTQIAVGNTVIVYGGELTIYNSSVYETKSGSGSYLYSLNGVTSETVPTITVSEITGVAAVGVSGATTSVTLANNDGWSASVAGDGTIVTSASISGSTITYSVAANSGDARTGYITVTLTKSGRTDAIATINVSQLAGNGDTSATVSFTGSSSGGMTTTAGEQTGTKSGVTVQITNGVVSGDQIRIYKNADITITAPSGKNITKVVFTTTTSSGNYSAVGFPNGNGYTGSGNTGTWTGSSQSVTLNASAYQVRATEIKVTYE